MNIIKVANIQMGNNSAILNKGKVHFELEVI